MPLRDFDIQEELININGTHGSTVDANWDMAMANLLGTFYMEEKEGPELEYGIKNSQDILILSLILRHTNSNAISH